MRRVGLVGAAAIWNYDGVFVGEVEVDAAGTYQSRAGMDRVQTEARLIEGRRQAPSQESQAERNADASL